MSQTITVIDVYHGLNRFLGTIPGELAKNAFELILFTLVTYMVASEWTRSRDEHKERLQWLIWGFGFLSAIKLLSTIALSYLVLGGLQSPLLFSHVSILDNVFEILAVIMISIGFLQPVVSDRHPTLLPRRRYFIMGFILLGGGLFLLLSGTIKTHLHIVELYRPAFFEFNLAKLLLSVGVIFYIISHKKAFLSYSRYYPNVIHALVVYAITPILHIINLAIYNNQSGELLVLAQPFPFIAVLLFTRVIFLQLADKAALYDELARTEAKYKKEKELSDLKDDFVSVVSHELKTPLTAISLWSSLFLKNKLGKVTKAQKDAILIIKKETTRLSSLINDVLDLSKLEKGKMEIKPQQNNLRTICNLDSFRALAQEKKITLTNSVPEHILVRVDAERFTQVIYNLVSNAIKFTEPGGKIVLSATQQNPSTIITITDTGIGIPPEKISGIFSKFYQVDNHLTRKAGGTGLGLSISKHIVELHRGTITLQSTLGRGTTFTITLPNIVRN